MTILTIFSSNPTTNRDVTIEICDPLTLSWQNMGTRHQFFTHQQLLLIDKTSNLNVVLSFLILF